MRMGWRTHVLEHRTKCTYTVHDVLNPYGRKKNRTRVPVEIHIDINDHKLKIQPFFGFFFF